MKCDELTPRQTHSAAAIFTIALHAAALKGGSTLAEGGKVTPLGRKWGLTCEQLDTLMINGQPKLEEVKPPQPPTTQAPEQQVPAKKQGYRFGDFSRMLGKAVTGNKDYEFGDITKRALGLPTSSKEKEQEQQVVIDTLTPKPALSWGADLALEQLPRLYSALGLTRNDTMELLNLPPAPTKIDEVHLEALQSETQLAWNAAVYAGMIDPALYSSPEPAIAVSSIKSASVGSPSLNSIQAARQAEEAARQAEEAALIAASGWDDGSGWADDSWSNEGWKDHQDAPGNHVQGQTSDGSFQAQGQTSAEPVEFGWVDNNHADAGFQIDPPVLYEIDNTQADKVEVDGSQVDQLKLNEHHGDDDSAVPCRRSSHGDCGLQDQIFNNGQQSLAPNEDSVKAVSYLLRALATSPSTMTLTSPLFCIYDARSRVALLHVCRLFRLPPKSLHDMEKCLAQEIMESRTQWEQQQQQEDVISQNPQRDTANGAVTPSNLSGWSKAKVGAAAVAGGGLMLVTGGLAAPVIAGISGAVLGVVPVAGAVAGAVVSSSFGVAAITAGMGYYGAARASRAALEMVGGVQQFGFLDINKTDFSESGIAWKLEDLEKILRDQQDKTGAEECSCSDELAPVPESPPMLEVLSLLPVPMLPPASQGRSQPPPSLSLVICVSGFVSNPQDFTDPWKGVVGSDVQERFSLVFDANILRSVGWGLAKFMRDEALSASARLLTGIVGGVVALPLAAQQAISMINAPWRLALRRSQEAGTMLGRLLASGAHGGRPVTLIGYSMGARVVFYALLELSRLGRRGLVENAVLLGSPLSSSDVSAWSAARAVVAGRMVNAYSPKDSALAVIYRYKAMTATAAGLSAVLVAGVENVDVSDTIQTQYEYGLNMPKLLSRIGIPE